MFGGGERSFRVWAPGHQTHGNKEVKDGGGKGGDWPFLLRRWRPWGVLRRRIFQGPWVLGAAGSSQDHLLGQRLKEVPCGHRCCGVGMSRLGPEHCSSAAASAPPWAEGSKLSQA